MKISRQIGQTSQILNLFVQDGTVTTGAGLANIPATTVSYTWFHNTQAAVSTGVAVSTASMGTYTSGAWTQISSSLALGWYQFGLPDGALATGDTVGIHFYVSTGAFPMVPLPVEIELVRDNPLQFTSSKVFLSYTSTAPSNITQIVGQPAVTSGAGILNASTQTLDKTGYLVNVTSFSAAITTNANVIQAYGSAIVTSASGQFRVSTQTMNYSVNVTSYQGQPAVTSVAGMPDVNVERIHTANAVTSVAGMFDVNLERIHTASAVTTVAGVLDVNLERIHGGLVTTTGTGIMIVSTQTIDKTGYSLTAAERASIMTVIDTTVISESYRASSAAGTITQMMYEVLANVTDFANSGTTRALNSVTSHAVGSLQYQYDSTTPSSITRIA